MLSQPCLWLARPGSTQMLHRVGRSLCQGRQCSYGTSTSWTTLQLHPMHPERVSLTTAIFEHVHVGYRVYSHRVIKFPEITTETDQQPLTDPQWCVIEFFHSQFWLNRLSSGHSECRHRANTRTLHWWCVTVILLFNLMTLNGWGMIETALQRKLWKFLQY